MVARGTLNRCVLALSSVRGAERRVLPGSDRPKSRLRYPTRPGQMLESNLCSCDLLPLTSVAPATSSSTSTSTPATPTTGGWSRRSSPVRGGWTPTRTPPPSPLAVAKATPRRGATFEERAGLRTSLGGGPGRERRTHTCASRFAMATRSHLADLRGRMGASSRWMKILSSREAKRTRRKPNLQLFS
jgi:hypothetical protein